MKVYNQQLRKLNLPNNVKDKQDIIDSEGKLHQLGYIDYLKNLPDLDPSKIPDGKFIKTLIYGVRSSGNQAEFGLRKVAELSKEEYPEVNEIIQKHKKTLIKKSLVLKFHFCHFVCLHFKLPF